jgi:hypothetical protein
METMYDTFGDAKATDLYREELATEPTEADTATEEAGPASSADEESQPEATSTGSLNSTDEGGSEAEPRRAAPFYDHAASLQLGSLLYMQLEGSKAVSDLRQGASTFASLQRALPGQVALLDTYRSDFTDAAEEKASQVNARAEKIEALEKKLSQSDFSYTYQDLKQEYPVPPFDASTAEGTKSFGKSDVASLGSFMARVSPEAFKVVHDMLKIDAEYAQGQSRLRGLEKDVAREFDDLKSAITDASTEIGYDDMTRIISKNAIARGGHDDLKESLQVLGRIKEFVSTRMAENPEIKGLGDIASFLTSLYETQADSNGSEIAASAQALKEFTVSQRSASARPFVRVFRF